MKNEPKTSENELKKRPKNTTVLKRHNLTKHRACRRTSHRDTPRTQQKNKEKTESKGECTSGQLLRRLFPHFGSKMLQNCVKKPPLGAPGRLLGPLGVSWAPLGPNFEALGRLLGSTWLQNCHIVPPEWQNSLPELQNCPPEELLGIKNGAPVESECACAAAK